MTPTIRDGWAQLHDLGRFIFEFDIYTLHAVDLGSAGYCSVWIGTSKIDQITARTLNEVMAKGEEWIAGRIPSKEDP